MIENLIRVRSQIETLETALKKLKEDKERIENEIIQNAYGAKTIKTDIATVSISPKIFASVKGGAHDTEQRRILADLIRSTGEKVERLDYISDAQLAAWCKSHPDSASYALQKGLINLEVKNKVTLRLK